MVVKREGSNIVVDKSVAGSIFPTNEKDTVYPVLVDGSRQHVKIEGALYGRAVELRGDVMVCGPIVARGDLKINPLNKCVHLSSGLTVNGSVNYHQDATASQHKNGVFDSIQNVDVIIKGDIAVNQNIFLKNAVVLGSLRAVNCTLENTVVLAILRIAVDFPCEYYKEITTGQPQPWVSSGTVAMITYVSLPRIVLHMYLAICVDILLMIYFKCLSIPQ